MNKTDTFDELTKLLITDKGEMITKDEIVHYLCDYFDTNTLNGFIEHIKEEQYSQLNKTTNITDYVEHF